MHSDHGITRRGLVALAVATATVAAKAQAQSAAPAFKRAYADGPYGQIHYRYVRPARDAGKPPLVCLHASPLSGVLYENWIVEMGRDRFTLAPDTPGYGGSDGPPSPPQIADYAGALVRFLDEMKLNRVDLMGYHTGSMTSIEMARRFPQRVRKVVMISAPIFTPEELAPLRAAMGRSVTYESMLQTTLDNWRKTGKGMFRDVPTDDRYVDISLDRMRRFRTGGWGFNAAFDYDLPAALAEVRQPILLLNPEDDLWQMTPRAMKYAKTATQHDLPGWTHGHLDAHTVEMAAIVRKFLDA